MKLLTTVLILILSTCFARGVVFSRGKRSAWNKDAPREKRSPWNKDAPRENPELRHLESFSGVSMTAPETCTKSSMCPAGQCCRNADGYPVNNEGFESGFEELVTEYGKCSNKKSGPGERCTPERCSCVQGYECYRTITGACCPPYTCWRVKDAQEDRDYWNNCSPPDCYFPPAPPAPEP